MGKRRKQDDPDYVDPKKMIALEEEMAALKKEYGIGGHTHAVSRAGGSYEDHGSKGITLKKAGCADVQMNWNKVASRIS